MKQPHNPTTCPSCMSMATVRGHRAIRLARQEHGPVRLAPGRTKRGKLLSPDEAEELIRRKRRIPQAFSFQIPSWKLWGIPESHAG